ncbi:MAG: M3 family oligoendopeptidase [Alphaproteobacteria bacterium]|nr:M3 family oligoendopeptidase [Alphaproteobacteria bacterium]
MKVTNKNQSQKTNRNNLPAWDLSCLYANVDDPQIGKDLSSYFLLNKKLAKKYKGKLETISAVEFYESLRLVEKTSILGSKLVVFAYLNMVTRMKDKQAVAFYQNIDEKMTEYAKPAIFYSLEINKLSSEKYKRLLQDKQISYYKPFLERIRRFKKHELSETQEAVFMDKSVTSGSAWKRLYDEHSAKLVYSVDGKQYNDAEISKLLQDKDPLVREKAGKELNRVSKENSDLFTFIYNMIVKDKSISDEYRQYKSPVSARNLDNQVDDAALKALVDAVRGQYQNIAGRFYKLKAKWLGVKKIQYWDRNAPLPFSSDKTYGWEESVKIVLDAYGSFSSTLQKIALPFFDAEHSWIDVPPRDGKRSGAFAMPLPAKFHPFLMLNFVGKQNDVLTLAHELGHGCHMRLAIKQGELNEDTPMILAEVASVFAEMITFQSLLSKLDDDKAKLCLIASKVNDMINTSLRQIAFHCFETRIHQERKKGELSSEQIEEIWLEEMQTSLGKYVVVDDNSRYIWPIVSHFFHSPFYVYAYSFADCLVNSLYQVYQEQGVEDFADKYLQMLSQTGVKKYDVLLKPFGLNAKDPEFWNKGLSLISSYIDELEKLDKKVFK